MKQLLLFFSFILLLASNSTSYSETMKITKTGGEVIEIDISDINQISFDLTTNSLHDLELLSKIPIKLLKNYPNPFNPTTTISYDLVRTGDVKLSIFNSKGQMILKEELGEQKIGSHQFKFDGNKYNSGVYFYQVSVGTNVQVKKMMMIK